MEYQEKVERLKRYRMLDAKIANLTEELQVWQARATKITASFSSEPKASGSGDKLQKCVDKICEIQSEITQEMVSLKERKKEIEEAIKMLKEKSEEDILWYRYIKGMTFEEIAVQMNYSWRQVYRKHRISVEKLKMS